MTKNRFEKNPIYGYIVILVFIFIIFEFGAYVFLSSSKLKNNTKSDNNHPIAIKHGYDFNKLKADNKEIYKSTIEFHPYRWYKLKNNYKGNYINLDDNGFRNKKLEINKKIISFFGGSTMYSLNTLDEYTIPSLVNNEIDKEYTSINYGIGAYNLTSEMMTFFEVIRTKEIKYAIFYDGVNEIGRHVEAYERNKFIENKYFESIGNFHHGFVKNGIQNTYGYKIMVSENKPFILRLLDTYLFKDSISSNSNKRFKSLDKNTNDKVYDKLSNDIIQTYLHNVKTITATSLAYGITPIFLWQPDVYVTKKILSENEKKYFNGYFGIKKLTKLVLKKIQSNKELKKYNFYDISDSLDDLDNKEHFFDYCHVDRDANKLIAKKILEILNNDFLNKD